MQFSYITRGLIEDKQLFLFFQRLTEFSQEAVLQWLKTPKVLFK